MGGCGNAEFQGNSVGVIRSTRGTDYTTPFPWKQRGVIRSTQNAVFLGEYSVLRKGGGGPDPAPLVSLKSKVRDQAPPPTRNPRPMGGPWSIQGCIIVYYAYLPNSGIP